MKRTQILEGHARKCRIASERREMKDFSFVGCGSSVAGRLSRVSEWHDEALAAIIDERIFSAKSLQ
jgi:hypothetical protein